MSEESHIAEGELSKAREELKRSDQVIFDNTVEPNCATCTNQIGSKNCDNGIICVEKVKAGKFTDWSKISRNAIRRVKGK